MGDAALEQEISCRLDELLPWNWRPPQAQADQAA
jgi:hypothetical protein